MSGITTSALITELINKRPIKIQGIDNIDGITKKSISIIAILTNIIRNTEVDRFNNRFSRLLL